MKRFVVKLFVFLIIILVADYLSGMAMDFFRSNAKGGQTGRTEYIINHSNEDILIMGSSRASHHYDPQIIEDELGLSSYNCGYDGQGIIFHYALLQMILERYKPKLILLEVSPPFDINMGDNSRYIKFLRQYSYNEKVRDVICDVDNSESVKLISNFYRYNTYFLTTVFDFYRKEIQGKNGFLPNYEKAAGTPQRNPDFCDRHAVDPLKMKYFESFISCCRKNDVDIVVTVSPMFTDDSMDEALDPIKNVIKHYNVPILNHSIDKEFNYKLDYFSDNCHLNVDGAKLFTKVICSELHNRTVLF